MMSKIVRADSWNKKLVSESANGAHSLIRSGPVLYQNGMMIHTVLFFLFLIV